MASLGHNELRLICTSPFFVMSNGLRGTLSSYDLNRVPYIAPLGHIGSNVECLGKQWWFTKIRKMFTWWLCTKQSKFCIVRIGTWFSFLLIGVAAIANCIPLHCICSFHLKNVNCKAIDFFGHAIKISKAVLCVTCVTWNLDWNINQTFCYCCAIC